jgi:hypothetical protein
MKHHRWSGWPGAYCLDCGAEDPIEAALACLDCHVKLDDSEPETKLCNEHESMVVDCRGLPDGTLLAQRGG